jgi:hypothetical protein
MTQLSHATCEDFFRSWPDWWPSKEAFVSQHDVSEKQLKELQRLLGKRASEREIDRFLSSNKEVLSLALFLFSTGHHATWIYPKQQIRPSTKGAIGLIPDYVMAGANSDGVSWWVLELKGPDKQAFKVRGGHVSLTADANDGICQLLDYIDISSRSQAYLREELKLAGYREPRGVLLIGTEEESENERIRDFKGAWNRMNPRVQIRSYTALLREVESKLESRMRA